MLATDFRDGLRRGRADYFANPSIEVMPKRLRLLGIPHVKCWALGVATSPCSCRVLRKWSEKMKAVLAVALIVANAVGFQAYATDSRVYKSGPETVFCTSKASAKNFQRHMEQKDVAAAGSVIQSGGCSIVTPSLDLFIDSEDAGVVGVRRKGLTSVVWTFKHMLR